MHCFHAQTGDVRTLAQLMDDQVYGMINQSTHYTIINVKFIEFGLIRAWLIKEAHFQSHLIIGQIFCFELPYILSKLNDFDVTSLLHIFADLFQQ